MLGAELPREHVKQEGMWGMRELAEWQANSTLCAPLQNGRDVAADILYWKREETRATFPIKQCIRHYRDLPIKFFDYRHIFIAAKNVKHNPCVQPLRVFISLSHGRDRRVTGQT